MRAPRFFRTLAVRIANHAARMVWPNWPRWAPTVGLATLLLRPLSYGTTSLIAASVVLVVCILAAVHHAEVVAHLAAMATLVLVLPSFAVSPTAPTYSTAHLVFIALVSSALYATFLFVQTIRHRDYFLPAGAGDLKADAHASPPTTGQAAFSFGLLLLALVSVVLLAKACLARSRKRWPQPRSLAGLLAS